MRILLTGFIFFMMITAIHSQQPDSWIPRADFPGTGRTGAAFFSVGDNGYLCGGQDSSGNVLNDFWTYDSNTDTWSQLADFPGTPRRGGTGFGIDTIGYMGTGLTDSAYVKDFWKYNPVTNVWTQLQSVGDFNAPVVNGHRDAASVAVDGRGYLIGGYDATSGYLKHLYEFDPSADTSWARLKNIMNLPDQGYGGRRWGCAFEANNTLYFGLGYSFSQDYRKDFWSLNRMSNTWTQVADFAGADRSNAIAFSVYGKGYVATGTGNDYYSDMYVYIPSANSWQPAAPFPGMPVANAIVFRTGNRIFAGLGIDSTLSLHQTFYEYIADSTVGVNEISGKQVNVYPTIFDENIFVQLEDRAHDARFDLYDAQGRLILSRRLNDGKSVIAAPDLAGGIYFYSVNAEGRHWSGKLIRRTE